MSSPSDRDSPSPQTHSEHAKVLAEVMDEQKRRKEARDRPRPRNSGQKSFYVQVALLVSGTFFFYLLFFSPTWIAPTSATQITAERTEDSLRFYLFMVARQLDAFRSEEGRLPANLDEIPGVKPDTEYTRLSNQDYRIGFSSGSVSVTYESRQDTEEFLGNADDKVLRNAEQGSTGEPS